jgi:hypothetical protein
VSVRVCPSFSGERLARPLALDQLELRKNFFHWYVHPQDIPVLVSSLCAGLRNPYRVLTMLYYVRLDMAFQWLVN